MRDKLIIFFMSVISLFASIFVIFIIDTVAIIATHAYQGRLGSDTTAYILSFFDNPTFLNMLIAILIVSIFLAIIYRN